MLDAPTLSDFLESCVGAVPDRDAVAMVRDWFCIRTHPGMVRTENQDRVAVARWTQRGEPIWVVAVADGIASGKAGAEAASMGLATFISALYDMTGRSLEERLLRAGELANQAVYHRWRGKEGTTLSAVVVSSLGASLLNIGDSRIYGIKAEKEVRLLTKDDIHPSIPGLLQFVGMGRDLVPHVFPVSAQFTHVLLTSDGVHNYVEPLLAGLVRTALPDARALVDRLTHLSVWCGGADNSTSALAAIAGPPAADQMDTGLDVWTPGIRHRMPGESTALRREKLRKRDSTSSSLSKRDGVLRNSVPGSDSTLPETPRPAVAMTFGDENEPMRRGGPIPRPEADSVHRVPPSKPDPEFTGSERTPQPVAFDDDKESPPHRGSTKGRKP